MPDKKEIYNAKNNLNDLRLKAGISLKELSEKIEIPYQTLRNYDVKKRDPNGANASKIAAYFGVTVDYLMNGLSANFSDPDPDNTMRTGYLTSNIEAFTEVINSAIASDYESNKELGRLVMDFLGATSYLLQNGDTDSLTNLQSLMEQLTSFNKGLYRGNLFQANRTETSGDSERYFTDEARQDEAVANYFDYSKKINDILNEYFLTQFNKRYKA